MKRRSFLARALGLPAVALVPALPVFRDAAAHKVAEVAASLEWSPNAGRHTGLFYAIDLNADTPAWQLIDGLHG